MPKAVMSLAALLVAAHGVAGGRLPDGWRGFGMCPDFKCEDAATLNASWFYTWKAAHPCPGQTAVPWVPLIFNAQAVSQAAALKGGNHEALLGFNEPDCANQGNIGVSQALDLWPQLMATGLRLGSPAPASFTGGTFTWLKQFVDGVKARGLRLDFLAVHFYLYNGQTLDTFRQFMEQVKATYPGWKVWITEISVTPGGAAGATGAPAPQQIAFLNGLYDVITSEYSDVVERFAWFTNRWATVGPQGYDLINSTDGKPTPLGQVYMSKQ